MNGKPGVVSRFINGKEAEAFEPERVFLGSIIVGDTLSLSQQANNILGGFPDTIDVQIGEDTISVPSASVGDNTSDLNPFSFLSSDIALEIPEMRSAINAIMETCIRAGLQGEELRKVVSENAKAFLEQEISRINNYIQEQEKKSLEDKDDSNNTDVLIEYRRRLNIESRKFGVYLVESRRQDSKSYVEKTLSTVDIKDQSENKKPVTEQVVSTISSEIKNIFGFTGKKAA